MASSILIAEQKKKLLDDLADVKRRLGPYTKLQSEQFPHQVPLAEVARRLVEVVDVLKTVVGAL